MPTDCRCGKKSLRGLLPFYVSISALWLLLGCGNLKVDEKGLKDFIADPKNGLSQEKTVNGATVAVACRPTDLLVAQEVKGREDTNLNRDSLRAAYEGRAYFTLTLSKGNQEIENQFLYERALYNQALQYLTHGMAGQVRLITANGDTVPTLGYVYPRMYGSTGKSTIMLVYDKAKLTKASGFTLFLHDTLLGLGEVSFVFKREQLERVPSLAL
jgi:hypothetical protein